MGRYECEESDGTLAEIDGPAGLIALCPQSKSISQGNSGWPGLSPRKWPYLKPRTTGIGHQSPSGIVRCMTKPPLGLNREVRTGI